MNGSLRFRIGTAVTEVRFSAAPALEGPAPAGGRVTVFDTTTAALFGQGAENPVVLQPGEAAKQWASAEKILARCAALEVGRDGAVVGVGGGVVCDIAALAASLYMRGCRLVLAPTTLLAMVDASLGGKTGVDFLGYKNLVGTFYPAELIIVAPGCLRSLPEREMRSGIAEAIKTAIIGDRTLFALLAERRAQVMERDEELIAEIVRRCLVVKGRIVEEDPTEAGLRAVLNLGHTFGHALETATGFSVWSHGEAVAWGIGRALAAGTLLGLTDASFAAEAADLLTSYGFSLGTRVRFADLAPGLARDKKRRGGKVRVVIPRAHCLCVVQEIEDRDLERALAS